MQVVYCKEILLCWFGSIYVSYPVRALAWCAAVHYTIAFQWRRYDGVSLDTH